MNGNESVETFQVSLFPVDSLYCFFFNPFLNSCDVYSGLCLYLFVCLYSCFFQKAPLVALTNQKRYSFLGFQVHNIASGKTAQRAQKESKKSQMNR